MSKSSENSRDEPKLLDPESRENQLIALAVDRAEEMLINGTASSQIIAHYLKLASSQKEKELDLKIKERELELIEAKTENLKASAKMEEVYEKAMRAFSDYSGNKSCDYNE